MLTIQRVTFAIVVFATSFLAIAADFKPGDKVEVQRGRDWVAGEVVSARTANTFNVKINDGRERTVIVFANRMRVPGAASTNAPAADPFAAGKKIEKRIWTDATGNFKIEAVLVEFKNGNVKLRTDEREITLPLDKLSDADQKLINTTFAKPKDPAPEPAAPEAVAADGPATWSVMPSQPIQPTKPLVDSPIMLGEHIGHPFFEAIKVLGFDRAGGTAFFTRSGRVDGKMTHRLERVDLVEGKSLGTVSFEEKTEFFDVDPTGKLLAVQVSERPGIKSATLDLWDISGLEPKKATSFEPFAGAGGSRNKVSGAQFVDKDHVVVTGSGGLTMWNIPQSKAIYHIETKANNQSAVSANGKLLAAVTKEGMFVFDALTGKSIGKLAGDQGSFMKLAFSPDGHFLASHVQGGRLQIWNCEKGERIRDLYLTGIEKATKIDWVGGKYLMVRYVGPSFLVDIDRRVIYWKYEGIKDGQMLDDRYWCVAGLGEGKALYPGKFPHEAALKSAPLPAAADLLLLKPGTEVKLDVKTPAAPDHKIQVEQTLSARLDENGISVSPKSDIILEAVSEKGKTKSLTFRSIGRIRGGNDTVQVTEQIYRMTLKYQDNVMWETKLIKASPHLLRRKEGQSIEDALAEYTKPDLQFFINKPLPRLVAKPGPHDGAYGKSKISANGIE